MIKKISIKDTLFSHAFSSSNWFKPDNFEWDFNNVNSDYIFLTDDYIINHEKFIGVKKYAWLVESPSIKPNSYKYVLENGHKFDKIFTFDSEILDKYKNSYPLYIGGCHLSEDEISLNHKKESLISMMISSKNFTPGHNLRHNIFNVKKRFKNIDFKGDGVGTGWAKKGTTTVSYKFSVVVENIKKDFYFTEKIIDCFLSGCVPIYWGCPSIGTFFNSDGFLMFDNIDELENIINNEDFLNNFYESKKDIIIENFEKALFFKIGDNQFYSKYLNFL
jgi:hypothetical protein